MGDRDDGTPAREVDLEQVRAGLAAVLGVIDAGEVQADQTQRAYIVGALDALTRLTDP